MGESLKFANENFLYSLKLEKKIILCYSTYNNNLYILNNIYISIILEYTSYIFLGLFNYKFDFFNPMF